MTVQQGIIVQWVLNIQYHVQNEPITTKQVLTIQTGAKSAHQVTFAMLKGSHFILIIHVKLAISVSKGLLGISTVHQGLILLLIMPGAPQIAYHAQVVSTAQPIQLIL